jgi:D-glycero-D-manno-heptose 1,7-bisphosphate phosphatase
MRKAVFLDRDGTIIIDKIYLNSVSEIEYLPKAIEGMKRMRDLGFEFVIATNQSGIARGLVDIKNLYAIHEKIREDLSKHGLDILGFYYAPYAVETNHYLRKPNPGMLLTAAKEHGIDLTKSWMIGDRTSDVDAGHNAGTRAILLVPEGANEKHDDEPEAYCHDLVEAADVISRLSRVRND